MSLPGLEWDVRLSAFAFSQRKIIFKLTIDIFTRKIILQVKYFIKSMILKILKFFKRIAFSSRNDAKTLILL